MGRWAPTSDDIDEVVFNHVACHEQEEDSCRGLGSHRGHRAPPAVERCRKHQREPCVRRRHDKSKTALVALGKGVLHGLRNSIAQVSPCSCWCTCYMALIFYLLSPRAAFPVYVKRAPGRPARAGPFSKPLLRYEGEVLFVDEEEVVKFLVVATYCKKEVAFSTAGTSAEYILREPAGGNVILSVKGKVSEVEVGRQEPNRPCAAR